MRGGSGHAGSESSAMDALSEPSTMDASSESNTTDTLSSVLLPTSPLGSTALSDTESESTTLAVANVIATAPLTLTIVAGVTVMVDIPESRSPAGRKGRRVVEELRSLVVEGELGLLVDEAPIVGELVIEEEPRSPAIKAPTPSPLEEPPPETFDNVALVGDCDDTVTSIPDPQGGGNEGFMRSVRSVLAVWAPELGIFCPPSLRDETPSPIPSEERSSPTPSEETLGPNETSGNTGPILRSTSASSGGTGGSSLIGVRGAFRIDVGSVLVGVDGSAFLVVGVGGTLLSGAGDLDNIARSGAPSVISAPNDTSGRVGGVCFGVGVRVGESILEVNGESTLEVGPVDSEGGGEGAEGEGEVDGVDITVEVLGEWDFEDEGVDGRDEVDGERDVDIDGDSDSDWDGDGREEEEEEGSENPGRSELLLPSPISAKGLFRFDSANLPGFASSSRSSKLLPLPPLLPLSSSNPLSNPAPQSSNPRSELK